MKSHLSVQEKRYREITPFRTIMFLVLFWFFPPHNKPLSILPVIFKTKFNLSILIITIIAKSEKAMAPHSSTLAWRIPWMEEPGRLQSMGSLRVTQTERCHFHFSLSCIGQGNGNPLQCSCLENPRDGGA